VNGSQVATGRIGRTQPNIFSADETADVGIDNQTPVAEGIGIGAETEFTGRINKILLEIGAPGAAGVVGSTSQEGQKTSEVKAVSSKEFAS
jgi:hypothetical protein